MKKRMFIMLLCLVVIFGSIIAFKLFVNQMIQQALVENASPIIPVSVMKVGHALWQQNLTASGSLRAIQGVNVTTELPGMVQRIYFTPGDFVKENDLLVQLNADTEIGQLASLEAQAALAQITLERDKKQFAIQAVSKQTLDADMQNLKSAQGQVFQQKATVAKKSIHAPFSGRVGINNINLGQFLNPGDTVTSLQTLDPIYADFYMPQQTLSILKVGMPVTVITDTYPNKKFQGKITTINPNVQNNTRNVIVEATLENKSFDLIPGMFVTVDITIGKPIDYLTLPQTAITYNPYGNLVYVVKKTGTDAKGDILTVSQAFVITGQTRGDQVTILKGLKQGEAVVTSGQLKLKNGSRISINNKIIPINNPRPTVSNTHEG